MKSEPKTKKELDRVWGVLKNNNFEMPLASVREEIRKELNAERIKERKKPIAKGWTTFQLGLKAYRGQAWSKGSDQSLHINRYLQHLASMEKTLLKTTK